MSDPKVIRIAVTAEAKQVIAKWASDNDMTEIGVASRIYEWFARQEETVQRAILGMFGSVTPDIVELLLRRLPGETAGPSGSGGGGGRALASGASTDRRQRPGRSAEHSGRPGPGRKTRNDTAA